MEAFGSVTRVLVVLGYELPSSHDFQCSNVQSWSLGQGWVLRALTLQRDTWGALVAD